MRTVRSRFAHDGVQGKRLAAVAAATTTVAATTTTAVESAAAKPAASATEAPASATTEPAAAKTTRSTAECSAAKTAMRPEYGMLSKGSVVHPKRLAVGCCKARVRPSIHATEGMLREAAGTRGIQCDSSPSHG